MADIQAFMTGFLGARAQKMQADQAKADDYEDRLRNIALRNQQIAMNRDALSNAAKGMGDQLLSWGATPDQIQAALKSGQTGLASLYKTVKGVKDTLGEDETKRFLGTVNADIGAAAAVVVLGVPNENPPAPEPPAGAPPPNENPDIFSIKYNR